MVSSVQSPADVVNIAMKKAGIKGRIGNLYDGSEPARVVLDFYSQTRDATLRAFNWGFAERFVSATISGGTPPAIWAYEYNYPSDCLQVRGIYNSVYVADKNNPLPNLWTIGNNSTQKVIWSSLSAPTICYTGQITDPSQWEPLYVETFTTEMAKMLAVTIGVKEAIKVLMEEEKDIIPLAEGTLG